MAFDNYVEDTDLQQAFRKVRDQALWDYGHAGYTGTIAEKDDVELRRTEPMLLSDAYEFAEKDGEENDKWGPAFAVPVRGSDSEAVIGFLFYGWASS